jgi:iron complex outermembrane receptor protein
MREPYYQNWVSSAQKAGSNYGDERYFQRDVFGSGASYNYLGKVLDRDTRFVIGLDWMREFENRERWNLTVGNGRTRGAKYQDYDITLYTAGLYSELNYQVYGPLRMVVGSRYDMFDGSLTQRLPSGTWDRSGPEIFSPKAGLILTVAQDRKSVV